MVSRGVFNPHHTGIVWLCEMHSAVDGAEDKSISPLEEFHF